MLEIPDRLKSYRDNKEYFRIFVNEEYDKIKALLSAATSVMYVDSKEANDLRDELYTYLNMYNIDCKKTTRLYKSECLKLIVISTENNEVSREQMIGLDIEDSAMGYSIYHYDKDYHKSLEFYKQYGLTCNINEIKTIPLSNLDRSEVKVLQILKYRDSLK